VNYRTGDEDGIAILLDRELCRRFGRDQVFRAARSISPGEVWEPALLDAVRRSTVLIAVIGRRWRRSAGGGPRQLDWTRREIVEAFACGVRVIPVLVGTVAPPAVANLPAPLAGLARCQYLRLDHHDMDAGIDRLVAALGRYQPAACHTAGGKVRARYRTARAQPQERLMPAPPWP
jgi:hypothetical protein